MDAVNVFVCGTSNSVLQDGYFTKIRELGDIRIVGSLRVGDVASTFFARTKQQLETLNAGPGVDVVVLDSFINDVLMVTSGVLSTGTLRIGLEAMAAALKETCPAATRFVLLDFCPEAVARSGYMTEVRDIRLQILRKSGLDVRRVVVEETGEVFRDGDPLHHRGSLGAAIAQRVVDREGALVHSPRQDSDLSIRDVSHAELGNVGDLANGARVDFYATSLLSLAGLVLAPGDSVDRQLSNNHSVLGVTFVSTVQSDLYLCIEANGEVLAIPTGTAYGRRMVRFVPIPDGNVRKTRAITLSICTEAELPDSSILCRVPNPPKTSGAPSDEESTEELLVEGLLTGEVGSESASVRPEASIGHSTGQMRKTRVYFESFWPGFKSASDPVFGRFLSEGFRYETVDGPEDADVVVVSWNTPDHGRRRDHYEELRRRTDAVLVYYTAEHDGAGLQGAEQVDLALFDYVISHYYVSSARHAWMPNYVRRYGLDVFDKVNRRYSENIEVPKQRDAQFCYSNPNNEIRNEAYRKLSQLMGVDCGGKLFNDNGIYLPREPDQYIESLSTYRFVFAFENSKFPGYHTEKLVHALMAGSVPLYWGDNLVHKVWNPSCFIDCNDTDMDALFGWVATDPEKVFDEFRMQKAVPFPEADEFEAWLKRYYQRFFAQFIKTAL